MCWFLSFPGIPTPIPPLTGTKVKTTFHDRRLIFQSMKASPSPRPLSGAPWRVPLGGRRSTSVGGIAYRRVEPSATKRRGAYRSPWRLSLPQTHPPHPRSAVLTAWTRGINPPLTMCAGTARRVRTGGVWERVKGRGTPRVRERGVEGCTRL